MEKRYALITLENDNGLQEWHSRTVQTLDGNATQEALDALAEGLAANEWRGELADEIDEWDDNLKVTVKRAEFISYRDFLILRKYLGEA